MEKLNAVWGSQLSLAEQLKVPKFLRHFIKSVNPLREKRKILCMDVAKKNTFDH